MHERACTGGVALAQWLSAERRVDRHCTGEMGAERGVDRHCTVDMKAKRGVDQRSRVDMRCSCSKPFAACSVQSLAHCAVISPTLCACGHTINFWSTMPLCREGTRSNTDHNT
eukprot:1160325-Pelagomonas_calceolata.AAC.15